MSEPFEPSASELPPLPAQVHEPFLNASHGPWIESPVRAPIWRPGDLPAIPFGGSSDEQDGSLFPGAWPGRGPGSDQADFRSPVRRQSVRHPFQIGRASCRESLCQYASLTVVAVSFTTKPTPPPPTP